MTTATLTDVLVVGAGIAGLYAARLLRRAGLTVAVIEARDRVGGRAWSHRLADRSYVDSGAQWIGPGQRRIYALAREFGLATILTHTQGDAVVEVDGRLRRTPGATPPISWSAKLDALQFSWSFATSSTRSPPLNRGGIRERADWTASPSPHG